VERERDALRKQLEEVYQERNRLVLLALALAHQAGYDVGHIHDPEEPEWPCLAIQLGDDVAMQVSWHVPQVLVAGRAPALPRRHWDGHSTKAKAQRIANFLVDAWPGVAVAAPGGGDDVADLSDPGGG
jgi:hypothetical protein